MKPYRGPRLASVVTHLVLAALYIPIASVAINSFNADDRLATWGGPTLRWWTQALGDARVRTDLLASLTIGLSTTVISVAVAVLTGLWWRHASPRARRVMDVLTSARIMLPEVVLAVGLFLLAERAALPLGASAIVAGQVVFCSAYAAVVIQARLAVLGTALEDAAADLGASPSRVFGRVTLPLLAPAILAAALLVFTFSLDDVVIAQFLGGTETETLPVLLLGKIRLTVSPEVNAIGTGLLLITAVPVMVLLAAGRLPLPARRRSTPGGER
ncbi:ABC transporter permease [Micromonospora sp. DT44]|uniref:ABC transporter permease n=1 Tax=Micromonospora sp. DT44 TaxID=3393439 RepID=UPI003CF550F9